MYYLYEIRESDSNDCTVYDCIIEADTRDAANDIIGGHFDAEAKAHGWESDGSYGYYFPCTCETPEEPFDDPAECDQCEVLSINGVACHETGCPTYAKYKRALRAYEDASECPGHGGLDINTHNVREYATEEDAEKACSVWHSRYEI